MADSRDLDVRRILDVLRWIVRDLRRSSGPPDGPSGLSAAQRFVLHTLHREPGLSLGELADRTATDQSSVSVVVRKLHEKRLVRKRASRSDGRRLEVSLTKPGIRLVEGSPSPVQEALVSRISGLDPEDRTLLRELLERIAPVGLHGMAAPPMFFDDLPGEAGVEDGHEGS